MIFTMSKQWWIHLAALGAAVSLAGCVERTISITSDPSGALVFLNDEEIGRTPCEAAFLHYGTYDVRIVKDGYEPYMGPAEAKVPLYDLPGPDLVAAFLPVRLRSRVEWHFTLLPVQDDEAAMIDRARQLRSRMEQKMGSEGASERSVGEPSAPSAAGESGG